MSAAIRIVLVDTSHPGNIGASARAMKNMGLQSLVLVRPGSHPDPEATARASGAADVLAGARVTRSVDEAIVAAAYGSLNLAQAVQIVCYEVRMALAAPAAVVADAPLPATADERRALDAHLERVMRASGFMHDGNAGQLGARVRRLVARASPDDGEVRILRGWLAAIERRLRPGD